MNNVLRSAPADLRRVLWVAHRPVARSRRALVPAADLVLRCAAIDDVAREEGTELEMEMARRATVGPLQHPTKGLARRHLLPHHDIDGVVDMPVHAVEPVRVLDDDDPAGVLTADPEHLAAGDGKHLSPGGLGIAVSVPVLRGVPPAGVEPGVLAGEPVPDQEAIARCPAEIPDRQGPGRISRRRRVLRAHDLWRHCQCRRPAHELPPRPHHRHRTSDVGHCSPAPRVRGPTNTSVRIAIGPIESGCFRLGPIAPGSTQCTADSDPNRGRIG